MKNESRPSLRYKDAGVDIDAGNSLVDLIGPAVKSTRRKEVLTGLGGFGGLFQLDGLVVICDGLDRSIRLWDPSSGERNRWPTSLAGRSRRIQRNASNAMETTG